MKETIKYAFEWNDRQKVGHINFLIYDTVKKTKYWRNKIDSYGWYVIKEFDDLGECHDFSDKFTKNKRLIIK